MAHKNTLDCERTRSRRLSGSVFGDDGPTTSRADLIDVLATALLARLLTEDEETCVDRIGTTTDNYCDSSLAFHPEQSPDGVRERGHGSPAGPHRNGRTS